MTKIAGLRLLCDAGCCLYDRYGLNEPFRFCLPYAKRRYLPQALSVSQACQYVARTIRRICITLIRRCAVVRCTCGERGCTADNKRVRCGPLIGQVESLYGAVS